MKRQNPNGKRRGTTEKKFTQSLEDTTNQHTIHVEWLQIAYR